jgi:putative ABC transport system substrate-binding protein
MGLFTPGRPLHVWRSLDDWSERRETNGGGCGRHNDLWPQVLTKNSSGQAISNSGKNRRMKAVLLLSCFVLASIHFAEAQQLEGRVPRIGFLGAASASALVPRLDAFRQGLHDLGYIEGKNIVIEYRYADGNADRIPDLGAELVGLKVDIIVTYQTPSVLALKKVSTTIPIVFTMLSFPVENGIVASFARPGGNATGLTVLSEELNGKRLELLKETVPKSTRIAVLSNPANPTQPLEWKEIQATAQVLGMKLQSLPVRSSKDFDSAFEAALTERAQALLNFPEAIFSMNVNRILEFAAKNKLPAMYSDPQYTTAGGLMSYSPIQTDLFRRAATYVDKILKGAKPADLPVEQPTKFELVINLKTAKQIGLTIPPSVLARADRVIK